MSVESTSAPVSAKPVTGAHHRSGKAAGKPEAAGDVAAGGFAALMGQLSAAEPASDALVPDGLASAADSAASEFMQNVPVAQVAYAQTAINSIAADALSANAASASVGLPGEAVATVVPGAVAVAVAVADEFIPNVPVAQVATAKTAINSIAKPALAAGVAKDAGALDRLSASTLGTASAGQMGADAAVQSKVDALLGHRSAMQSQTLSAVQLALREVKPAPVTAPLTISAPDAAAVLAASGLGESLLRPFERSAAKLTAGQSGAGFDGAFGPATAAGERAQTVYEITAPAATVPESGVAETVSYWVTRGVQSAELTLDGFGADPVEVRISVNGDQAQIDFRTDQADVRQMLAGAAAQLKDLLSGQGLQLAGVSIGDSGKGNTPGDAPPPRPGTKRAALVAAPAMLPMAPSRANLSVGQSLDLFV